MPAHVQIRFLGGVASSNLTGSCLMVTIRQAKKTLKLLVDAGFIQGRYQDSIEVNKEILNHFKPSEIDYIILTHSHIDHIGRLPLFVSQGFTGRIICTSGTKNLLQAMLEDTAKIQMAEASFLNSRAQKQLVKNQNRSRHRFRRGNYDREKRKVKNTKNHIQPLYTLEDVAAVENYIKNGGYPYREWIRLAHGVSIKFYPSGHVMGGAVAVVKIDDGNASRYLCFSGDLGREDGIILPPPEKIREPLDALIIESTYGGRSHPDRKDEISVLLDLLRRAHRDKQRIIIPSFALERSQEIIYLLSYYMKTKKIPAIPIYLDSPLAEKITTVFSSAWEAGMFSDQAKLKFNPFSCVENEFFNIVTSMEESDALIKRPGCYIVIAGSGMCDAGRVRGHLRTNLKNSDTVVCLIGYMAENSLGRKLKEKHYSVNMNKEEIIVKAEIISFDSFSAHADGKFLSSYARSLLRKQPNSPKKIFLIHGSKASASDLEDDLKSDLSPKIRKNVSIRIPKLNEVCDIF